ncbi:MAG: hypothetical protein COT74_09700 [Bdellovibrionales bacterium CG10_big_fil_rev_8_21_14_0_10_45_34]|nr:MAG: hypothetical protein COT74_09700 [Bdellovibrionales bacterium CG10_big_fil_rev_8_21_14_0_10_45_34]
MSPEREKTMSNNYNDESKSSPQYGGYGGQSQQDTTRSSTKYSGGQSQQDERSNSAHKNGGYSQGQQNQNRTTQNKPYDSKHDSKSDQTKHGTGVNQPKSDRSRTNEDRRDAERSPGQEVARPKEFNRDEKKYSDKSERI